MKKNITCLLVFITTLSLAQAPEVFNYQSVLKDNLGNALSSQAVGMEFEIKQGSVSGTTVYAETWSTTTNATGLVMLTIGEGVTSNDFSSIDWSNGPYFLEIGVDVLGGTSYVILGTTQLLSVPYALHAKRASNGLPSGTAGDIVYHDGTTWITLPRGTDGQILTLSGGVPTWGDLSSICTTTFYLDSDGDGYGDNSVSIVACFPPPGYVADNTDCNDAVAAFNPGAVEICNDGIDNDCDGLTDLDDPSATGGAVWYQDNDLDGYGNPSVTITSCTMPVGYVSVAGDCDDTDADIHPDATEVCDGVDNDCDGLTDSDDPSLSGGTTWYRDVDGDTYGSNMSITACSQPPGYVQLNGDCDDTNANVHPGATEVCDGKDNDCNGLTDSDDPSLSGGTTWYRDNDSDGFGSNISITACSQPSGYVQLSGDCNDLDSSINPIAPEIPNDGIDNNCNGLIDEII